LVWNTILVVRQSRSPTVSRPYSLSRLLSLVITVFRQCDVHHCVLCGMMATVASLSSDSLCMHKTGWTCQDALRPLQNLATTGRFQQSPYHKSPYHKSPYHKSTYHKTLSVSRCFSLSLAVSRCLSLSLAVSSCLSLSIVFSRFLFLGVVSRYSYLSSFLSLSLFSFAIYVFDCCYLSLTLVPYHFR